MAKTQTSPVSVSPEIPAVAGGSPVREEFLPFARVEVGEAEERAVIEVLRSGWLSSGPRTEEFEAALAAYLGARNAVGVSSCTAGLHLALRAAGVGAGDEVIAPAITFPSSVNAVVHAGAEPRLADVSDRTFNIDPSSVETLVTAKTKAIVAVHLAGNPAPMDQLRDIARSKNIGLIEDAAHALGSSYRGRPAGTLGDAAAFSFYATKNLTTGEGGMVTTIHDDWAARIRVERLHGIDLDASRRKEGGAQHWEAVALGWKYNLTDLAAAMGLVQLEKLPAMLERRRLLADRYRVALGNVDGVRAPKLIEAGVSSAHLFSCVLDPDRLRISRDDFMAAMAAEKIGVGVHFRALPAHRFFRGDLGLSPSDVPRAMSIGDRIVSLPLFAGMTDSEQTDVIDAVSRICRYYRR